jgi:hypothetical protein
LTSNTAATNEHMSEEATQKHEEEISAVAGNKHSSGNQRTDKHATYDVMRKHEEEEAFATADEHALKEAACRQAHSGEV